MKSFYVMSSLLRVLMIFFVPVLQNGNEQNYQNGGPVDEEEEHEQGIEEDPIDVANPHDSWFHEQIEHGVISCLELNSVEHEVRSDFQDLTFIDIERFGKALVMNGHLQTTTLDEFIYHESLVHPALLVHNEPKSIFIMGGGSGSTAREVLKHKDIEKVVICEIDSLVVDLCREHMIANQDVFNDDRLQIVYNEASDQLQQTEERFDVILCDTTELRRSVNCNHLFEKSFYEEVAKPKLKENGIFVTLAGPAGIFTHKDVFSLVYNTLKQVFTYVVAYTTQMPSYRESCGWVMASDQPIKFDVEQLNNRIGERISGELRFLDGDFIAASTVLNKILKTSLMNEEGVITRDNAMSFVRGRGW